MRESSLKFEQRLGEFLRRLYACRDTGALAATVARDLASLVAADQIIFNYLRVHDHSSWFIAWPGLESHDEQSELFLQHMHEHPKLHHYWNTGDPSAGAISDFMSVRQFHRTGLYNELYRQLGYEDHLGFLLGRPGPAVIGVGLGRGSRSFTARDRQILDLVRPHIAQAWRNAKSYSRLTLVCRRKLERSVLPGNDQGAKSSEHPELSRDFGLSPREYQVMAHVARGMSNHEIAATLFISPATVRKHLEHVFSKLGVNSRTAALARMRGFCP